MGNSNSAGHSRSVGRGTVNRGLPSRSARGKRNHACATTGTAPKAPQKHHKHQNSKCKSQQTLPLVPPMCTGGTQRRAASLPAQRSTCDDVAQKLSASVLSEKALLLREESGTSKDSLADEVRAAEEMSGITLDTFSSCPLVGPRNITTQFEQISEPRKSGSGIFGGAVIEGDDVLRRQSSSVAELMRQESFEGRLTHSIAVVECWFAAQERNAPAAA